MKKFFLVMTLICVSGAVSAQTGVLINGVTWATHNVGKPGTFVDNPEDFGNYYKYRKVVCPTGWRLPTNEEVWSLVSSDSQWTNVNGVDGMQYGSGGNTIFLPAAGRVKRRKLELFVGTSGFYWTSTKVGLNSAHDLLFYEGFGHLAGGVIQRKNRLTVRCVKE